MSNAVALDTEFLSSGRIIRVVRAGARTKVEVECERDPRTMNRMDPATRLVHARLEEWGKWARDRGIQGYPRQSLTEKAAQYGKLGIPQESNYRTEPLMPEDISNVDSSVSRLMGVGQNCVKRYYTEWQPPEVMAQQEGLTLRRFQEILRRSRELIGLWLDDLERKPSAK